jgi:hypothetical protein
MEIDRSKKSDAQKIFEILLPDKKLRQLFSAFLVSAIERANSLDANNWNLNLDITGKFIRLNVGQEYCIELDKDEVLVLCNKKILTKLLPSGFEIKYCYHNKKEKIVVNDISKCKGDCLANVSDSVGCIIDHNMISKINYFMEPMFSFIDVAIKTTKLLVQSKNAHSSGAIDYFAEITNKSIQQPKYVGIDKMAKIQEFQMELENKILRSEKDSSEARLARLANANKKPDTVSAITTLYKRNPDVIVEVLKRAKGVCERCKKTAPFNRKSDNTPYLEVHHKIALAEGGEDTVENAIALCPNCHRELHFGK